MTRRILLLQQVSHEPAALIDHMITKSGLELVPLRVDQDEIPQHADGYCAVIIMGGPTSANDDTHAIQRQQQLIQWCLTHGTPLLGICLGAQLMAKAIGGKVIPAEVRELGWYPLHPTQHASADPLFSHLVHPHFVFQWHGETFSLPEQATLLASSPQVPNQAFRLGKAQYGLQFHVEIDAALVDCWIDHGSDERAHLGSKGVTQVQRDTAIHVNDANALCRQMIARWIALL